MQKHVNIVDLYKSFPTNVYLQNLASMQPRTSHVKFARPPRTDLLLLQIPQVALHARESNRCTIHCSATTGPAALSMAARWIPKKQEFQKTNRRKYYFMHCFFVRCRAKCLNLKIHGREKCVLATEERVFAEDKRITLIALVPADVILDAVLDLLDVFHGQHAIP